MTSKWRSEWLDWQPAQQGFEGFDGSIPREHPIIQGPEEPSKGQIMGRPGGTVPSKPSKLTLDIIPTMPPGVTLLEWNPKPPPVGISYCAVVNDVEGFIADTLTELGSLLDSKVDPDRARKLRDLVDALEQCGVIVQFRLWQ